MFAYEQLIIFNFKWCHRSSYICIALFALVFFLFFPRVLLNKDLISQFAFISFVITVTADTK